MAFLARNSLSWVLVPAALAAICAVLAIALDNAWYWASAALFLVGTLFLANFYRDPERAPGEGIVAPADGVVQLVDEQDGQTRIVTFMNPLNVHVNRMPLSGRVVSIEHKKGGYVPAWKKEAMQNERVVWQLETAVGPVKMVQIAGTLARRIVPYVEPGVTLEKGERYGMIRLGSRVDLYVPKGLQVAVKPGDKVAAGESTLVRLDK
ncbi:MAG TPA: phosphatidylserine decarboxylase [Candidatus Thermoplasmatota archaeon]|nr:phosphatidylserine decarboxylase [Candidatus Thermoplasmatota archaeon]